MHTLTQHKQAQGLSRHTGIDVQWSIKEAAFIIDGLYLADTPDKALSIATALGKLRCLHCEI